MSGEFRFECPLAIGAGACEEVFSTGFGHGFAFSHCRSDTVLANLLAQRAAHSRSIRRTARRSGSCRREGWRFFGLSLMAGGG